MTQGFKSTRKTTRKITNEYLGRKFTSNTFMSFNYKQRMLIFITVDAVFFLLLNCITDYCNYSHSFSVLFTNEIIALGKNWLDITVSSSLCMQEHMYRICFPFPELLRFKLQKNYKRPLKSL